MSLPVFEQGSTVMFTWVSSVPPDSAPLTTLRSVSSGTVVSTLTAVASDSTHFYALVTMPEQEPGSRLYLQLEWRALKTFAGTPFPFIKRYGFLAEFTRPANI